MTHSRSVLLSGFSRLLLFFVHHGHRSSLPRPNGWISLRCTWIYNTTLCKFFMLQDICIVSIFALSWNKALVIFVLWFSASFVLVIFTVFTAVNHTVDRQWSKLFATPECQRNRSEQHGSIHVLRLVHADSSPCSSDYQPVLEHAFQSVVTGPSILKIKDFL